MKKSHKKLEIVLLDDLTNLGQKGDKVEVAKGYAINYLIPEDLAVLSSDPRAKAILRKMKKERKEKTATTEKVEELAKKIEGLKIEIKVKTGAKGKLFGSVAKSDILKELGKASKIKIGKVEILGDLPIKKIGEHKLKIKLASGVEPEIKVKVSGKTKNKSKATKKKVKNKKSKEKTNKNLSTSSRQGRKK